MPARYARRHLLGVALEAVRAGFPRDVVLVLLIRFGQRTLAVEALSGFGFVQARIHAHASVEHEALAIVVLAAALLEVFEDAAVELEHVFEALALHERPGFLAADAAGAEHHDRLLLQLRRELADAFGKVAEVIDADRQRVPESAELHFVIVARVEQRDGAAFIEPALELARRELR